MADPELLFELVEKAAGQTWQKATRRDSGEVVAVKVLPDVAMGRIEDLQLLIDDACGDDSPAICHYLGSYLKNSELWIAMEWMEGGTVAEIIDRCGPLSEADLARVLTSALNGLVYLHARGTTHEDVRGSSILVDVHGQAKLVGPAHRAVWDRYLSSRRTTYIGTPYWMSPELIQQIPLTSAADIWSLGITAFEMATGHPPLHDMHPMRALFFIMRGPPPVLEGDCSEELMDFVATCLQHEPGQRPTAADLLEHRFLQNACTSLEPLVLKSLATGPKPSDSSSSSEIE